MSLLLRINLVVGIVSVGAGMLAAWCCWTILEGDARREVLAEAGLMMDSAGAIRSYTATEILPLLEQPMRDSFLPQGIPLVRQIAHTAERLSVGDMSATEFPRNGPTEMASLVRSFNRMRTSLEKAMRLLER